MHHVVRTVLTFAGASLLVASKVQSAPDGVEVVILNGPNAGTYKSVSDETVCVHFKAQKFSTATWRDAAIKDPKKMSAAAIKVDNPEQAGPKKGDVEIDFGDRSVKNPVTFRVSREPVTMTVKGKSAVFTFEGVIKGITLKVRPCESHVRERPFTW